jgi:hypothetical protein
MSKDQQQAQQEAATPPVVRLASAEVDVAAAKDRLNDTVARLQSKLDPKLLAKGATDEAKRVGDKGVMLARENQEALLGLAGAIILYLLRKPLLSVFRRRKYPKPQRAAKPMTATAPNERLARSVHPTQRTPAQAQGVLSDGGPAAATTATHTTAAPLAPQATSNEGAQLQGATA